MIRIFKAIQHFWHKRKYNNIYINITKIKDDLRHKGIIFSLSIFFMGNGFFFMAPEKKAITDFKRFPKHLMCRNLYEIYYTF